MKNLTAQEARQRILAKARLMGPETVNPDQAYGRVLAEPVVAARDQPPFRASAMDGYALRSSDALDNPAKLHVIGESAAGMAFEGAVALGQAVRIFTGAPVPDDCDHVVIQENVQRDGDLALLDPLTGQGANIRAQGGDFQAGAVLLETGARLDAWRLSLAASAGASSLTVIQRPRVAVLSTGDELVEPGQTPSLDQIYNSGSPAVCTLLESWGAQAIRLHSAVDDAEAIAASVRYLDVDLIVTLGGASVGDHDLVKPAMAKLGLELSVETIALRPGKPTWFGTLGDGRLVLGLPGNPASALVCAELFLRPLVNTMLGLDPGPAMETAQLATPLPSNGPREHWMRAILENRLGMIVATPFRDQDSSLVSVFAKADALICQPAQCGGLEAGSLVQILRLNRL
jgi:molybdopterin molybdotransferase